MEDHPFIEEVFRFLKDQSLIDKLYQKNPNRPHSIFAVITSGGSDTAEKLFKEYVDKHVKTENITVSEETMSKLIYYGYRGENPEVNTNDVPPKGVLILLEGENLSIKCVMHLTKYGWWNSTHTLYSYWQFESNNHCHIYYGSIN